MIPPTARSQGNILINNSSSHNIYPTSMDCEPSSVISISSSSSLIQPPPSLNISQQQQQQQRYLQHLHNSRNSRYIAPSLGSSFVGQKYIQPSSLPIDLISAAAAAASNNGTSSGNSSIMVLPTTQDHHLNSSTSLIINHQPGSSRNHNSNTSNNNSTNDESSMVGVCVQQSPVVIH